MAKLLIVEDEPIIAQDLQMCMEDAGFEVIGISDNADQALHLISESLPDLALLDINIRGQIDGIDLANQINNRFGIPFVFLTSYYDKTTLSRASLVNPSAYILKPFKEEEMVMNVRLALNKSSVNPKSEPDKMFVRDAGLLRPIQLHDLLFAKGEDNYTKFFLRNGQTHTLSQTLKLVESKLPDQSFCRVHKSYVINTQYIDLIEHSLLQVAGHAIPIGKSYRARLFDQIQVF